MKIVSSILIAIVAFPLCISIATSYIVETKALIPQEVYASMYLLSYNLGSEPALMIPFGTGLITIAGIGRRKIIKNDNDHRNKDNLAP